MDRVEPAKQREAMETYTAPKWEEGPSTTQGESARQSGAPLLRFADLAVDTPLLDWARELAPQLLDAHPQLAERHVGRWLGGKSEYLKA